MLRRDNLHDSWWRVISAAEVGAAHERQRVWVVAVPCGGGQRSEQLGDLYELGPHVGDRGMEEVQALWRSSFPLIADLLHPGVPWYCFGPQGGDLGLLLLLLKESGLTPRHILIWRKNRPSFSIGRLDYDYQHEPIVYGWVDGAAHRWYATEPQTSLLEFDRPQASPDHATAKPVPLLAHLIGNSTRRRDLVLDPFAGSGSILVAAEETGRVCAAIEIAPQYVDVTVARWERLAPGNDGTLIRDGARYSLADARGLTK